VQQVVTLVATGDRVPQLDVEPVCDGIAKQGGVTFRDPAVAQEKKNCIESELAVREELVNHQRNDDGRRIELHGVAHLSGNGARCASDEG
jgi:hypothetical protein